MVAPFLASLKSWISLHPPPIAPRSDRPIKGITVWKAKGSSTVENQPNKAVADMNPSDSRPGRSFRNFKFDTGPIFQAIDTAFSS
ncbi:mRNA-decapping enzyme subunit 2-like [Primulina eburnea]